MEYTVFLVYSPVNLMLGAAGGDEQPPDLSHGCPERTRDWRKRMVIAVIKHLKRKSKASC
jgi:hypothetical protein